MSQRKLLWFVTAFAGGLALAYLLPRNGTHALCVGLGLIFLFGWVARCKRCRLLAVTLCAALFGLLYMGIWEASNKSSISQLLASSYSRSTDEGETGQVDWGMAEITAHVSGRVVSPVLVDGDRVRFALSVRRITLDGGAPIVLRERLQVTLGLQQEGEKKKVASWTQGKELDLLLSLRPPPPRRNFGAFDYSDYLHRQRIHWTGETTGLENVGVYAGHDLRELFWQRVQGLRSSLAGTLQTLYSAQAAGLLEGMLLGQRESVAQSVQENFALLGIVHILAISGLHVGIVAGGAFTVARLLRLERCQSSVLIGLLLIAYAVLTGLEPPVVRAVTMLLIALVGHLGGRGYYGEGAVAVAAALMLLVNPYLLFDIGFQLSFAVTLALTAWVPVWHHKLAWPSVPFLRSQWVRGTFWVTTLAQWVSFPILIGYFHQFSLLSWLTNLIIIPFLSLICVPLGFLSLFLGMVHPAFSLLVAALNDSLLTNIVAFCHALAGWSHHVTVWPRPYPWWLLMYALFTLWVWEIGANERWPVMLRTLQSKGSNRRIWHIAGLAQSFAGKWILLLFLLITAYLPLSFWQRGIQVTVLDVGQGDAILVEIPRGPVWLVDGGGNPEWGEKQTWQLRRNPFDVGEDVVLPYLKQRGIRKIDVLVMTHGDVDHIGGLVAVVKRLPVKNALLSGSLAEGKEAEIRSLLWQKGTRLLTAQAGDEGRLGNAGQWWVLHPQSQTSTGSNDDSLVLWLRFHKRAMLLTGDVEAAGEEDILRQFSFPAGAVLKVAHHGSRTSTTERWLEAVKPSLAIVSAGVSNRYGHPHPEVVRRLQEAGIPVLRTDRQGAVRISFFSSGRVRVETAIPSSGP